MMMMMTMTVVMMIMMMTMTMMMMMVMMMVVVVVVTMTTTMIIMMMKMMFEMPTTILTTPVIKHSSLNTANQLLAKECHHVLFPGIFQTISVHDGFEIRLELIQMKPFRNHSDCSPLTQSKCLTPLGLLVGSDVAVDFLDKIQKKTP
jgi:hypothetical protein